MIEIAEGNCRGRDILIDNSIDDFRCGQIPAPCLRTADSKDLCSQSSRHHSMLSEQPGRPLPVLLFKSSDAGDLFQGQSDIIQPV